MSQRHQNKSFVQSIGYELYQFIEKLVGVHQRYGIQFSFDKVAIYDNILSMIAPSSELNAANNGTLSNFLQSTLNNLAQKKLKKLYCKKEMTEISGSTKLFGMLNERQPSSVSFAASIPNNGNSISNIQIQQLFGVVAKLEPEKNPSSSIIKSSESDQDYKGIVSSHNKKLYKLYPISTKAQITQYALKYGLKSASEKFKISVSKIQLWCRSISRVKHVRGRKPIDPDMEVKVCEWLKRQLESGAVLTQKVIREKAKLISGSQQFKASKGWLQKFFKRRPELFEAYTNNRKNMSECFDFENECSHNIIKKQDIFDGSDEQKLLKSSKAPAMNN